jgi:hypothetical protein
LGNFPYFPRDANGDPLWGGAAVVDGVTVAGMPTGTRRIRRDGRTFVIDITPYDRATGQPIAPPPIPGWSPRTAYGE